MTVRKGVSTYIAAIFILFIFAAFMASLLIIIRGWSNLMTDIVEKQELATEKTKESLTLQKAAVSNGEITVTLSNTGQLHITIVKYYIRDLNTTQTAHGDLNEVIQTGQTKQITISNTIITQQHKYLIALITSRGNIFKYTAPYTPPTPTPTQPLQPIMYNLGRVAYDGTVTWAGNYSIPKTSEILGTANNTNLQNVEEGTVDIIGKPTYDIVLKDTSHVLYYSTFDTENPFTNGELTNLSGTYGTNWKWNSEEGCVELTATENLPREDYGGEYIALINNVDISAANKVYIAGKIKIVSEKGYGGAVFLQTRPQSLNKSFYELSHHKKGGNKGFLEIRKHLPPKTFIQLAKEGVTIERNVWYSFIGSIYKSNNSQWQVMLNLTSDAGMVTCTDSIPNPPPEPPSNLPLNPDKVGLGGYKEEGEQLTVCFDNVVVADVTPEFVNVTGVPVRYEVRLYNGSGALVDGRVAESSGTVLLHVWDAGFIISGGTLELYDESGELVASRSFDYVVGGYVYEVKKYGGDVVVRSSFDVLRVLELKPRVSVSVNTTVDMYLYIYNYSSGEFELLKDGSGRVWNENVASLSDIGNYVSNSEVILRLKVLSNVPFVASVDMLNSYAKAVTELESIDALLIGVGGSDEVAVYELSIDSSGNLSVSYYDSVRAKSVFNGYADITYDSSSYELYLLNTSGLYAFNYIGSEWRVVTTEIRATGRGCRLEAVGGYLIAVPGEGNNTIYIYNVESGVITHQINVGTYGSVTKYEVTAVGNNKLYLTLNSTPLPKLTVIDVKGGGIVNVYDISSIKLCGMAYDGSNYLYMISEFGPVYKLDLLTGRLETLTTALIFYPHGIGDRLEYYSDYLLFVRGDETSELYVIKVR